MSDAEGRAVLDHAVRVAAEHLGDRLSAAFALGSLAHGGFAPLVSDVDLMLVILAPDEATATIVAQIRDDVVAADGGGLAARLSIFWADWAGVREGVGQLGRLPEVDRFDLLDSGLLLHGVDHRDGAARPRFEAVVRQTAEFLLATVGDAAGLTDPDALVARGARPVTKAVLFPVRFLHTLETGRLGRNDDAARWFVANHAHADLAAAALRWRADGITEPRAARDLLAAHLLPTYALAARSYAEVVARLGHSELAADLARLADRLAG